MDATWSDRVVGVIGGLGPQATATFLDTVVRWTDAKVDQDHLDMIVLQHSTTPDRTHFILQGGEPDPGDSLARDAARLESWGAKFVVLPCNTAHYFIHRIQQAISIDLISIVDETSAAAVTRGAAVQSALGAKACPPAVGIMATTGTLQSGAYQAALRVLGAEPIEPTDEVQADIMAIIYEQVKAGESVDLAQFDSAVSRLLDAGADVVVLGCTELSVIYSQEAMFNRPEIVDSLEVLARRTIEHAGKTTKQ